MRFLENGENPCFGGFGFWPKKKKEGFGFTTFRLVLTSETTLVYMLYNKSSDKENLNPIS
jgi:hypothetical protein